TIAGSYAVTATASGVASPASFAMTNNAGAATHFGVSAPASASSGAAFSVTVTAQDQYNNTATGYAGTVHFTSTDPAAVLPANSPLASGVAAFSARLSTVESRTTPAPDPVTASIAGTSGPIAVNAGSSYTAMTATGSGTATAVLSGGGATCVFGTAAFVPPP